MNKSNLIKVDECFSHLLKDIIIGQNGYPSVRSTEQVKLSKLSRCLHLYVMGCPLNKTIVIDHINGDPLDNRRANLQFITQSANISKSKKPNRHKLSSIYKGVAVAGNLFKARVVSNKKNYQASFLTELQAAAGWDFLMRKHHPGVAFKANTHNLVFNQEVFDLLRIKNTSGSDKNINLSKNLRKYSSGNTVNNYHLTVHASKGRIDIQCSDIAYILKWYQIFKG